MTVLGIGQLAVTCMQGGCVCGGGTLHAWRISQISGLVPLTGLRSEATMLLLCFTPVAWWYWQVSKISFLEIIFIYRCLPVLSLPLQILKSWFHCCLLWTAFFFYFLLGSLCLSWYVFGTGCTLHLFRSTGIGPDGRIWLSSSRGPTVQLDTEPGEKGWRDLKWLSYVEPTVSEGNQAGTEV